MNKLYNLVQNENMKIYKRIRTWILVVLLVGLLAMILSIMRFAGDTTRFEGDNWKTNLQSQIQMQQVHLEDPDIPADVKKDMKDRLSIDQYSLEHNMPPISYTMWGGVMDASILVMVVTLFTVIIVGDMVAGEFTWGTIKLLLIRPASRGKILLSKYISTLLFSLFLLLVLILSAVIINGFFHGFKDLTLPYLTVNTEGVVQEKNLLLYIGSTYALKLVEMVMVITLAFMISTVFRSSSLAIGFSIFIMLMGQTLTAVLMRYEWGKYYLFANTDLTQYLEGRPLMEGMTMGFSITVLIVYFILFNALSWTVFKRRDVAA